MAKADLGNDGYLFRQIIKTKKTTFLGKKDKQLSYTRVRECLVSRLRLFAPGLKLGIHSLRSGGVTAADKAGIADRLLKMHGRWKTDLAKDGYMSESSANRLKVSQSLGL